jgi:Domain of unknown function (DUF4164)
MNDTSAVESAIKRLMGALDALDAAIELRLDDDRGRGMLTEQVHAFSTDRARLASELDGAQARAHELETTNREAARRLDDAMNAIRSVIAANQR